MVKHLPGRCQSHGVPKLWFDTEQEAAQTGARSVYLCSEQPLHWHASHLPPPRPGGAKLATKIRKFRRGIRARRGKPA